MAGRTQRPKRKTAGSEYALRALVALIVLTAAVQLIQNYPALVVVLTAGVLATRTYLRQARLRQLTAWERDIAVTDTMSGPQFEQYVAKLMRASGCSKVQVCGGAGDMGADVIGRDPAGRRMVVQCKRYTGKLRSGHVQTFAGTARNIHRADVALLVTTGEPTAQAWDMARRCGITLVDRPELARWVGTQISPMAT